MKRKKYLKNTFITLAIFIVLTAIAALLEEGWLQETLSSVEQAGGWLVGGIFGALILLYLGKGAYALWNIMIVLFTVVMAERIALLLAFITGMAYFALTGFIDDSAGLGAAILLSVLAALALFWLWRRVKNIAVRLIRGDDAYNLTNTEYFVILLVSLALAALLIAGEPNMFDAENIPFAATAIFLLLVVFAVILYWVYVAVKLAVRAGKYRGRDIEYENGCLVYHGSTRSFRIPLYSIRALEKYKTYTGIAAVPTILVRPRTTTMLVIKSDLLRLPFAVPWPGKDDFDTICSKIGREVPFSDLTEQKPEGLKAAKSNRARI